MDALKLDLTGDEADLVMGLIVDRRAKSLELAKNSRSRTTRHARSWELGILDRIAEKMGGYPVEETEDVDDTEAPAPKHDDDSDLADGKLTTKPPRTKTAV